MYCLAAGNALAQSPGIDPTQSFDHATTGFSLGIQHALARCESCHTQGVFRGTPRECASCHRNASRPLATQFPVRHFPTTLPCDSCHRASAWNVVAYHHQGVTRGTCATCHNGVYAEAKPAGHVVTIASCDTCHNTLTWRGTNYNHVGVIAGTCATCHNGIRATGKPANHVATTASCDSCHTTLLWSPASFPHDATMAGRCSTCHNGATATGKNAGHIPTTSQCDTCHASTTAFAPSAMNHTGLANQCSTCHNGAYLRQNAQAKSASHVATNAQCDSSGCHASTVTWATATFNHALASPPVTIGNHTCANCHKSGGSGLPKPTNHVPTAQACDVCHTNFTAFAPAAMSHDGTAGTCSTCHGVATYAAVGATGKSSRHVSTSAQCDVCHTVATWTPAHYVHDSLAPSRCSLCHNNVTTTGKGATHIPDNRQCDTCHKNYTAFRPAAMNHTGLTGQCSTCHSGAYVSENAQTKSGSHLVTTAQCDTCHKSTTTWATTVFDHSSVPVIIGDHSCSTCHTNGGTGLPKPNTHIPTTGFCDTCHLNFSTFSGAQMSHAGTAGQCSSCHNGSYVAVGTLGAQAKPPTHVTTALQCDSCHSSTSVWKPASYTHEPSAAGTCSTCHNGITATGKSAGHIPDARQCDTCHTSTSTFVVSIMNHTGLANQCSTCHNGAYISQNAQAKSAGHVATTQQCDVCHTSTTTWATRTFNHAGTTPPTAIGGHTCANAGCHVIGGQGLPKPTGHVPTTGACDNCHTNFSAFAPATMNHTGTTGQCSTCHNGAYTAYKAVGKHSGHITTSASCDACHSTTAWKPAGFSHTGVAAGTCANCHNGTTATGKIAGHIPTTASCDQCHRTSAWMPLLTPYSHSGVAVGSCANCHVSNYPGMDYKPAAHIPTTFACDQCHRTTAWLPPKTPYGHTGVAAGTCQTCHIAPYTSITIKPSNHIPTTLNAAWTACDQCHKSYTSFANARIHRTVFTSVSAYPGSCLTCHSRGNPYGVKGPPNDSRHTRAPGNGSCDQSGCHRSVTGF